MECSPIGISETPFTDPSGMPIQPTGAKGIKERIHIDIKPYVPGFEIREVTASGWLENTQKEVKDKKSDNRFIKT